MHNLSTRVDGLFLFFFIFTIKNQIDLDFLGATQPFTNESELPSLRTETDQFNSLFTMFVT